jgi:hypothetical protein
MGWLQQRERAKQHQQQMDAALTQVMLPNLFSGTKVVRRRSYACIFSIDEARPDLGTEVRIIDMHDQIDVYVGNTPIGYVDPAQVQLMREQEHFAERHGRSICGRITKVSKLANGFSIEVTD